MLDIYVNAINEDQVVILGISIVDYQGSNPSHSLPNKDYSWHKKNNIQTLHFTSLVCYVAFDWQSDGGISHTEYEYEVYRSLLMKSKCGFHFCCVGDHL